MPSRPEITGKRSGIGHDDPPVDPLELLTKRQLAELLAVERWTVDAYRKNDVTFPAAIWLTPTTPRWVRAEIAHWLAGRKRAGMAPLTRDDAVWRAAMRKVQSSKKRKRTG